MSFSRKLDNSGSKDVVTLERPFHTGQNQDFQGQEMLLHAAIPPSRASSHSRQSFYLFQPLSGVLLNILLSPNSQTSPHSSQKTLVTAAKGVATIHRTPSVLGTQPASQNVLQPQGNRDKLNTSTLRGHRKMLSSFHSQVVLTRFSPRFELHLVASKAHVKPCLPTA